jgi:hypothetical protein
VVNGLKRAACQVPLTRKNPRPQKPGFLLAESICNGCTAMLAFQPNIAGLKLPDPNRISCHSAECERDQRKFAIVAGA